MWLFLQNIETVTQMMFPQDADILVIFFSSLKYN